MTTFLLRHLLGAAAGLMVLALIGTAWRRLRHRLTARGPTVVDDYVRLGVNEYGGIVSVHRCAACGDEFTVGPPFEGDFGGCLAPLCPSYDIDRDVDYLLEAGHRLVRGDRDD